MVTVFATTASEGCPGLGVSNGVDVVRTGEDGSYAVDVGNDTIVFVRQPSGYRSPLTADNLPQFHYIHKPKGSPDLYFGGVEPTGRLPPAIDFPLRRVDQGEAFNVVVLSDTQAETSTELGYIARDAVPELVGVDAAFGVTLGDIVFDHLYFYPPASWC